MGLGKEDIRYKQGEELASKKPLDKEVKEKDSRKSMGSGVLHVGFRSGFESQALPFNNHVTLNGFPFRSLNLGFSICQKQMIMYIKCLF